MSLRTALAAALIAIAAPGLAAAENTKWPNYREGDFVIADCGGSVVSMSSNVELMGVPGRDCYTAAKGGVAAIAVAYAPQRVRVNAIAPSATMTERVKRLVAGNTALTKLADSHLLGFIEPDDIAQMALYLASDESRIVTGQVLPVDSGVTIS